MKIIIGGVNLTIPLDQRIDVARQVVGQLEQCEILPVFEGIPDHVKVWIADWDAGVKKRALRQMLKGGR